MKAPRIPITARAIDSWRIARVTDATDTNGTYDKNDNVWLDLNSDLKYNAEDDTLIAGRPAEDAVGTTFNDPVYFRSVSGGITAADSTMWVDSGINSGDLDIGEGVTDDVIIHDSSDYIVVRKTGAAPPELPPMVALPQGLSVKAIFG